MCHRTLLKYLQFMHLYVQNWIIAILYSMTYRTTKLQQFQNAAIRIITLARKHEQITPILLPLHWLTINYRIRIMFKILLIMYMALDNTVSVH